MLSSTANVSMFKDLSGGLVATCWLVTDSKTPPPLDVVAQAEQAGFPGSLKSNISINRNKTEIKLTF